MMNNALQALSQQEQLNFLLTNRIPRRAMTRFMGWYSRIENPWLTRLSLAVWKAFTDLDLREAEQQTFSSLQACFTRRLKAGARIIDTCEDTVISPCDAIVGECGEIDGNTVFQAKGFPYEIGDLIPDADLAAQFSNGRYITLRLKSSMYHRFHAPVDCAVEEIDYISGDTWNVNPIALKRIEKLYCRNERAVVRMSQLPTSGSLCMVPVAAILVASMKFHCLPAPLNLQYQGSNRIRCRARYAKGDEMGYFEHGSTIILFATRNYSLSNGITSGVMVRMGSELMVDRTAQLPSQSNLNSTICNNFN